MENKYIHCSNCGQSVIEYEDSKLRDCLEKKCQKIIRGYLIICSFCEKERNKAQMEIDRRLKKLEKIANK